MSKLGKVAGLLLIGMFIFCAVDFANGAPTSSVLFFSSKSLGVFYDSQSRTIDLTISGQLKTLPVSFAPSALAADPPSSRLYLLDPQANSLKIFDLSTLTQVGQVAVGSQPSGIAVSSGTGKIYIITKLDSTLSVYDSTSYSRISARKTEPLPSSVILDEVHHKIFVSSVGSKTVQMFDEASLQTLATYKTDFAPFQMTLSPSQSKLYVGQTRIVAVLDPSSLKELGYIDLAGYSRSILMSADGLRLLVPFAESPDIAEYDTRSDRVDDWFTVKGSVRGRQIDSNRWTFDGDSLHFFATDGTAISATDLQQSQVATSAPYVPPDLTPSSELVLNSDALAGSQDNPALDFDSSGNFVASWTDMGGRDGDGTGIFRRHFEPSGNPTTATKGVNTKTAGGQAISSVGTIADGDFVICWRDSNGNDGDLNGAFCRRFNADDSAKDVSEFVTTGTTAKNQYSPWADVASNGDFVVVWSMKKIDDTRDIWARRWNADGTPKMQGCTSQGKEFQVNTTTGGHQYSPIIAVGQDGRFIITWHNAGSTADTTRARLFDSDGCPIGSDFGATGGGTRQFAPFAAMDAGGNFVLAWQENNASGTRVRRFNSSGTAIGGSFNANTNLVDNFAPAVAMAPTGEFAVIWRQTGGARSYIRHFDASGNGLGTQFEAAITGGEMYSNNIAMDSSGNILAAWKHRDYDPQGSEIVARKFDVTSPGLNVACSANPTSGTAPQSVDFTSTPSGGSGIYTYSWDFNDDTIADSILQNPSFLYITPGTFHPQVTVDDGTTTKTCTTATVTISSPPVSVTSTSPSTGNRGDTNLAVSVFGSGFVNGATVTFNDAAIFVNNTTFQNSGQIDADITINAGAFQGLHTVTVTNPDTSSGNGNVFTVYNAAGAYAAAGITPPLNPLQGNAGTSLGVIITGTDFAKDAGLAVSFGAGVTVNLVTWNTSTQLTVNISIDPLAALGPRDVSVTNPGTTAAVCSGCFTVASPPGLSLISVSPSSVAKNVGTVLLTITGTGFISASKASVSGTGITKVSQSFIDATTIKLTIKIDSSTVVTGFHNVKVKNSKTLKVERKDLFQIN